MSGDHVPDEDESAADPSGIGDGEAPLAVVVAKADSERALAELREAGWYDADRSVREHGDGSVAIPIAEPPPPDRRADLGVREVVRQPDPDLRTRDLDDRLRERGWSDADLDAAPSSWAVVGTVVLVDVPEHCPDEAAVGEALLDLHRGADTVLAREGIEGPTREPERRVIAGIGDTETVHTEHGVRYALDLAEVMFSPGNKAERARVGALVGATGAPEGAAAARPAIELPEAEIPDRVTDLDPAPGGSADQQREHVFDMFAGAGYFTLPAAIAGARVTAAEIDPGTFGYLVENAQLNGVGDRVAAYVADCREVADVLAANARGSGDEAADVPAANADESGDDATGAAGVDRVIMGHYDAHEYLDAALAAVRPGGVVHYHAVAPEAELPDRPRRRIANATEAADRGAEVAAVRRVKSYGEGVWHVVADARIE